MQLANTRSAYGWISIFLHWVGAVGTVWLYFLGENIEHAKEQELTREVRRQITEHHVSIGMIFLAFLAARIIWHFAHKQPEKLSSQTWLNRIASGVMWAFLAMIAIQIVTGPLIEWSAMRPVKVFDWVSIPSPFSGRVEWLHEVTEIAHKYAPNLFWPLIILHVGGALKHLIIDRDMTVSRMIWPRR